MNEKPEKNTPENPVEPQQEKVDRNLYEWVQALVVSVLAVMLLFTFDHKRNRGRMLAEKGDNTK